MSDRREQPPLDSPAAASVPPGDLDDALDTEGAVATRPRPETKRRTARPKRFKVMLHNDDYTTMEFVVEVLVGHFRKTPAEATFIMLQVHHKGVGVAGVYPLEVAETKVAEVTEEARAAGMPLLLTLEPAENEGPGDGDREGEAP